MLSCAKQAKVQIIVIPLWILLLLSLFKPLYAADWERFRGSGMHTHNSVDVAAAELRQLAELRIPSTVVSSPVVKDGVIYLAAENGNLYAIDRSTMQLRWLFPAKGPLSSTPAIAGDLVYVLSLDGHLYAINTADGTLQWSFKTGGEQRFSAPRLYGVKDTDQAVTDPWDYFLSSPLVSNGKVYFGSSDQRVYALEATTGKLVWSFKTGGVIHSSPALADGTLLIGSWDGALYALQADSGKALWRFQTETEHQTSTWLGIQSSPVVDGDTVYLGSRDGYLYAVGLQSGEKRWRYDVKRSWVVPVPAVDDTQLYFGTSDTGQFIALNKHTGAENWRADTKVWTYSSPVLTTDAVLVGNMKGDFFAFDKTSGKVVKQFMSATASDNPFGAVDATTGRFNYKAMASPNWYSNLYGSMQRILHSGGFLGSPAWHGKELILVTTDGQLLIYAN